MKENWEKMNLALRLCLCLLDTEEAISETVIFFAALLKDHEDVFVVLSTSVWL